MDDGEHGARLVLAPAMGALAVKNASDSVHRPWVFQFLDVVGWAVVMVDYGSPWKNSTYFLREVGLRQFFSASSLCLAVRQSTVAFGRTSHISYWPCKCACELVFLSQTFTRVRNEVLLSRLPAILSIVPFRVSQLLARQCHGDGALPYMANASS